MNINICKYILTIYFINNLIYYNINLKIIPKSKLKNQIPKNIKFINKLISNIFFFIIKYP